MSIIKSRMKRPSSPDAKPSDLAMALSIKKRKVAGPAMAEEAEGPRPSSVAEAIMEKRKAKKMAEGGMVDIQDNGDEDANSYDDQNEEAAMKELYDDSQLESQPLDSNEDGDMLDSDEHDMISAIRRKMAAKRGM